jgi:hypothetical protein
VAADRRVRNAEQEAGSRISQSHPERGNSGTDFKRRLCQNFGEEYNGRFPAQGDDLGA